MLDFIYSSLENLVISSLEVLPNECVTPVRALAEQAVIRHSAIML